jgi:hypothetical protein
MIAFVPGTAAVQDLKKVSEICMDSLSDWFLSGPAR